MMWVHVNKFGINEMFDAEQLRWVGFAREMEGAKPCVVLMYKDGVERLLVSTELSESANKCHELVRDLSAGVKAILIAKQ